MKIVICARRHNSDDGLGQQRREVTVVWQPERMSAENGVRSVFYFYLRCAKVIRWKKKEKKKQLVEVLRYIWPPLFLKGSSDNSLCLCWNKKKSSEIYVMSEFCVKWEKQTLWFSSNQCMNTTYAYCNLRVQSTRRVYFIAGRIPIYNKTMKILQHFPNPMGL